MENIRFGGGIMKTKSLAIKVLLVFALAFSTSMIISIDKEESNYSELENYLKSARIITAIPDENIGRTAPWIIELDDGTVKHKAMFKHISRCRPRMLPDCYKYELAAYELSKLLDLRIVPPAVSREIKGIPGSLQLFVEGCISLEAIQRKNIELPDADMFEKSMFDINVFENLTYCLCNEEDILVHLGDGKVCRVDFSEAFAPYQELLPECKITQCSQELFQSLKNLDEVTLTECLKHFLNEEEIAALVIRKNLILDALEKE